MCIIYLFYRLFSPAVDMSHRHRSWNTVSGAKKNVIVAFLFSYFFPAELAFCCI